MYRFCLILLFFAFVSPLKSREIILPKPIFSVGEQSFFLKTPYKDLDMMIEFYYPSIKTDDMPTTYMPRTLSGGRLGNTDIKSYAKYFAAVNKITKYPLVIMIPDFGNNRQNYTLMAEQIASRGYIVASIDHKTISNMIKFPDGIYTQKFLSLYKNKTNNKMTKHHYKAINETLKSISFFINNINEINTRVMEGCIDRDNIFLLGFGFGSNIAAVCDIHDVKGVIGVNQKKFNSSIVAKYLEKQSQVQMKDKKVLFLNSNDFDPMEKSSCTLHINGKQNDLSDFDNMDIGISQLFNFIKFKMKLEPLITSQNQKDSNICTTIKIANIIGSFLENNIRSIKSDIDYNKIGIIITDKTDHRINTILNQNKITPYNVTSGYINYFIDNISLKSNPEHVKNMIIIANPKYHQEAIKAGYNKDFIDKVILIGSEGKVGKNQNMKIETYDLNGKPIIINDRDPKIKHIKKDILMEILSDLHNLIRK